MTEKNRRWKVISETNNDNIWIHFDCVDDACTSILFGSTIFNNKQTNWIQTLENFTYSMHVTCILIIFEQTHTHTEYY